MGARGVAEGAGWLAVLAAVACCGVPVLLAAGLAGAVLWGAGLTLAVVAAVAGGAFLFLRRRRRSDEAVRGNDA